MRACVRACVHACVGAIVHVHKLCGGDGVRGGEGGRERERATDRQTDRQRQTGRRKYLLVHEPNLKRRRKTILTNELRGATERQKQVLAFKGKLFTSLKMTHVAFLTDSSSLNSPTDGKFHNDPKDQT